MRFIFKNILTLILCFCAVSGYCYSRYIFSLKWGESGTGTGQFDNPYRIIQDKSGNIYVSDRENHRIQKFDSTGKFILEWGSFGSDDGKFNRPHGIAIDNNNYIYVADYENNRIQNFDSVGNFIFKINSSYCNDLAVAENGKIYILDYQDCNINIFSSAGILLSSWGEPGSENGQFYKPQAIALDRFSNIYICDQMNNRIQKFDSTGKFILKFGTKGVGNGQFDTPYDVVIDSLNYIFVVDYGNNRIQKFDSSGNFITKFGLKGNGNGQFNGPTGLCIDKDGCIYVADCINSRIQKFYNNDYLNVAENNIQQVSNLKLSPNPFFSTINIKITNPLKNSIIKIYNLLGKEIQSYVISESSLKDYNQTIQLLNYPSGIYYFVYFFDNSILTQTAILLK